MRRSTTSPSVFFLTCALLLCGLRRSEAQAVREAREPVLVPFVLDEARELTVVQSALLVCNAGEEGESLERELADVPF